MDVFKPQLLLKRAVNIRLLLPAGRTKFSSNYKPKSTKLTANCNNWTRAAGDLRNSKAKPATPGPQTLQQIDNIQLQVNQKKSELLEEKTRVCKISSKCSC